MDQPIIISVIVPVYNIFEYLPRCVDSIRKQTYPYLDIILVDDGSTDRTGALAEKLALEDKRIRVFHKENGGSSSARNLGIAQAKGEYLGFVDSDDYIEPEMYERLLAAAQEENLLMVQCSRDEIDERGNRLPNVCEPPEEAEIRDSQFIMRELLLHRGDCSFCTRLTHRSLFENRRFPEGELNEDFYLLVQMLPEVPGIAVLPAGSIIPFSSELVMLALVKVGLNPAICVLAATLGNTMGGMTCYYMGHLGKTDWIEKYFKVKQEKIDKMQRFLQGKGALMAFFAFLPFIGEAIAIALGFMRSNVMLTSLSMFTGKLIRYIVMLSALQGALSVMSV